MAASLSTLVVCWNDAADIKIIDDKNDKFNSMSAYFKLKLAFYLGRHFWSH